MNSTEQSHYHQTVEQIGAEMELVKAAQKDPKQFEPLYTAHYKRIVEYVYHRLENKEEAFEITARVFYKALDNLHKYKNQGLPFASWLFRIAGNELNQHFRKNKSHRTVSIEEEDIAHLRFETDPGATDKQDQQLYEALQLLDADEMELIDMRFFEKRSFKEICGITGLAESACKMRVYRILEKLKTTLKK